ncbi:MAG TPA: TIGR01777 family oxidoreductase [Fibrobacteria bacterium]|nr:TIGR01777 family oxidoreductase [Fibrobacteria bacterium]
MSRIAIAGSTGLVGSHLVHRLRQGGHEVVRLVRRNPTSPEDRLWDPQAQPSARVLEGCDAVVNLSGHPIASGLWTASGRVLVRESRIRATRQLARGCTLAGVGTLVNASAVGYYGDRGDEWLDENSPAGGGFLADTCVAWEQAARSARSASSREVRVRFGTILSPRGGALGPMLPIFRMGLGGPIGTGRQWVSWIHIDDAVSALVRCISDAAISGAVLGVSPLPSPQSEFATVLGAAMGRPAIVRIPSFVVRAVLGRFGAELFLWSQRCRPKVLDSRGFSWQARDLESALESLLRVSAT